MALTMLNDNILIEPLETETKTASGIVIPDTAKEKPQKGKVVSVGPGKLHEGTRTPLQVKAGDVVIYRKWGGNDLKVGDEEMMVVKEDDILAIVN
jgi:chaperonin GroES